ncbi:MAG: hypothetical protein IKN24_07880 [Lachnospiraceae bacterium]|nr:hypothetical protein [Lachnospiraceae bacterium]
MRKCLKETVALMLSASMLLCSCAGKGGDTNSTVETYTQAQTTQAPETTQTAPEGPAPDKDAMAGNLSTAVTTFLAADSAFEEFTFDLDAPGGMLTEIEPIEADELSEEEAADIDRAMRAYKEKATVKVENKAEYYWLYEHMTDDQRDIYDAFYLIAQDPTSTEHYVTFRTANDPNGDQFINDFYVAWLGIGDDHPELWWIYYWNGATSINMGYQQDNDGLYTVYLWFAQAYENYEKDVKAFNAAFKEFMSDIDTDADEATKALQVHDKLIDWGIYDYAILNENKNDFGHTAFGPFVGNSDGTPHYCVCDGYAHAFQYALQQMDMMALVVCGMAGDAGADGGQGGHAWSMAVIDNKWYEIDACWDDHTDTLAYVEEKYGKNSAEYKYYAEMFEDEAFIERSNHAMYRLSTKAICNYTTPRNLYYSTKDGKYRLTLAGDSQRTRYSDYEPDSVQGLESALFPIADGKLLGEDYEPVKDGKTGDKETEPAESDTQEPDTDEPDTDEPDTDEPDTDEPDTEDYDWWGWEDETEEDVDIYEDIAGLYYVSGYNGFSQEVLSYYFGKDYYKSLTIFALNADGTGVLSENGVNYAFTYIFDGTKMYMYAKNGGSMVMLYIDGDFYWYDYYGNVYTFSMM